MNIQNVRNELCEFLRRSDVLSTTIRGVTRTTSSYTAGAGETTHTFTGYTPSRDLYSLTVNGSAKYYLRDYTMNWSTGVLTWNSALTGGETVAYSIDWGTGDKIYPDLPRDDLTLTSFPRVGIELTSISTTPLGLGGTTHISDMLFTVTLWAPVNKDTAVTNYGGMADMEETMRLIRDKIRSNAKLFYTFNWITPQGTNPIMKSENGKIMQHSQDFIIKFQVE